MVWMLLCAVPCFAGDDYPHLAPDGTYVGDGSPQLAPDGTYVGGNPHLAPDGSYVGGKPNLAPNGTYVGIKGIDPNDATGQYLTRQYIAAKYTPATEEDRRIAKQKGIQVHTPQQMVGNLKATTVQAMEQLKTLANQLERQASAKPTMTSQEATVLYQQLNNFIINSIKTAQGVMQTASIPPGIEQTTQSETQPKVQTLPKVSTPQFTYGGQPIPINASPHLTKPGLGNQYGDGPAKATVGGVKYKQKNSIQ